ncbi:MAG TPA: PASTA domain-containing protein [Solirubrobacterales bacterium]|nr:PASTA domain-containing protein [Solirubrobacterales bacterium]
MFVLLLALGVCAAPASAEPLSLTFTEGRGNVGTQLSVVNDEDVLFGPPSKAPFAAQIDPATGAITAGVLGVPEFVTHIEDPIDADVAVEFEIGTITGSFDQATGALTLSGKAGGTLVSEGRECDVSTDPEVLELSTSGDTGGVSPLFGAPFGAGLAGAGAIAGEWDDMHATALVMEDETFCEDVEGEIGGPGGIWLDQEGDVTPPPAPQLTGTDPGSPNASGTPRIRGAAEAGSTVRLYSGSDCAGSPLATASATELAAPGIRVDVAEGVTATFSATATDAVGNASACSASISYTRPKKAPDPKVIVIGDPPPAPVCVVPKLAGKTLGSARAALKKADCKLGDVQRPKRLKGKGKGLGPLVVKSSQPGAGAKPADDTVDLRLGPKPRKAGN